MKLSIPLDKQAHILAGYAITLTFGIIFAVWAGILIGVLAGIAKEVFDEYRYGSYDKRDAFFTWVGSILAGFLLVVL